MSVIPVAVKACKIGLGTDEKQRWLEEAGMFGFIMSPKLFFSNLLSFKDIYIYPH